MHRRTTNLVLFMFLFMFLFIRDVNGERSWAYQESCGLDISTFVTNTAYYPDEPTSSGDFGIYLYPLTNSETNDQLSWDSGGCGISGIGWVAVSLPDPITTAILSVAVSGSDCWSLVTNHPTNIYECANVGYGYDIEPSTFADLGNYTDITQIRDIFFYDSKLWVLESETGKITEWQINSETDVTLLDTHTVSGLSNVSSLQVLEHHGSNWWIADYDKSSIYRFDENFVYDDFVFNMSGIADHPIDIDRVTHYYYDGTWDMAYEETDIWIVANNDGLFSDPYWHQRVSTSLKLFSYYNITTVNLNIPDIDVFNTNKIYHTSLTDYSDYGVEFTDSGEILGNCSFSNNSVYFEANPDTKGSSDDLGGSCSIRIQKNATETDSNGVSFINSYIGQDTFGVNTYNLSDIDTTIVTNESEYGGGTSTTSTDYIYSYVQKTNYLYAENIIDLFLGTELLLIKEPKGLKIQTSNYANNFDLILEPNSQVDKTFFVKNLGESEINLDITCRGEFCSNIDLSKSTVSLLSDEREDINMKITILDIEDGEQFLVNIIVEDRTDETFKASLPVKITIDSLLGKTSTLISSENLFLKGIKITDDFLIPKFVILIVSTLTTFVLLTFAYRYSGKNTLMNWIRYLVTFFAMLIFLVLL